jgi:hypothetical protein
MADVGWPVIDLVIGQIRSISFIQFVFGKGTDLRLEVLLLIWCQSPILINSGQIYIV